MNSYAKKMFGQVRICTKFNLHWHNFTLQRGHLYGQNKDGYFVSALEPGKPGTIKVYRAGRDEQWEVCYLKMSDELTQKLKEAVMRRQEMGINGVEFQPIKNQKIPNMPKLRMTKRVYPWKPIHIPQPGTGSKTAEFVVC